MPKSQKPDGMVTWSSKRLASRFYQMKTGHCLTGRYLEWTKNRPTAQCRWCQCPTQTRDHLFKVCPEWEEAAENPVGRGVEGKQEGEEPVKNPGPPRRWKVQLGGVRLPLHYGCGKAGPSWGKRGREVSEWGRRERREREGERRVEAKELGAGEELPLFLPAPSFIASAEK